MDKQEQIQRLIRQLNETMTLKQIAEQLEQFDLLIDDTRLSKIMSGHMKLTRYKKLPELFAALENISKYGGAKPAAHWQEMPQLTGSYFGFYFDRDEDMLKPILLLLNNTSAELITTRYHYKGAVRVIDNKTMIIDLNVDAGNIPIVFYSNIDDILSAKPTFHINILVIHYTFSSGRGIVSGDIPFFYAPDAMKEYKNKSDDILKTYTHLADLQAKAKRYFTKPRLIITDCSILNQQEFDKLYP